MTDEELEAIEARANAATPGPWNVGLDSATDGGVLLTEKEIQASSGVIARAASNYPAGTERGDQDMADMEFIAHARTDIPRLLAEIRELRAALLGRLPSPPPY